MAKRDEEREKRLAEALRGEFAAKEGPGAGRDGKPPADG